MGATVRFRPERGTWQVTVHRNGKRATQSFSTEDEARAVADQVNGQHAGEDSWLSNGPMLAGPVVRGWFEHFKPTFSHGFEATASGAIENHLVPYFGKMPLDRIGQHDILGFVEKVATTRKTQDPECEETLSPKTAMTGLSIMRRVCQIYVDQGLLQRNPFARCGELVAQVERRHATEVPRADAWTRDEAEKLLGLALEHEPYTYGPILCGLHTGMRRGEIFGLEWHDVAAKRIVVRRAWTRGRLVVPKSGKAREIPKSPALGAHLDELRERIRVRRAFEEEVGPVFLSPQGDRIDEGNFGRAYRRLMKHAAAAGVRPLRFHDTRHTFASWALDAGRSIKWVQEMLGHASAELTLRTYSHLMPLEDDEMDFLAARPPRDQTQPEGQNAKSALRVTTGGRS